MKGLTVRKPEDTLSRFAKGKAVLEVPLFPGFMTFTLPADPCEVDPGVLAILAPARRRGVGLMRQASWMTGPVAGQRSSSVRASLSNPGMPPNGSCRVMMTFAVWRPRFGPDVA